MSQPPEAGEDGPVLGTLLDSRYELGEPVARSRAGDLFRARDRATRQQVTIHFPVTSDGATPEHVAREQLRVARAINHPSVCRVHDLVDTPWGPAIVMDGAVVQTTLAAEIAERRPRGGHSLLQVRRTATDLITGLAAIHARGFVHGDLSAESVLVSDGRAQIFNLAGASTSTADADDAATPAEDVQAAADILWSMCLLSPEPPGSMRAKPLRLQPVSAAPGGLAVDELKQLFRASGDDPRLRPAARAMAFLEGAQYTPTMASAPRDQIHAGTPPRRSSNEFRPSQALLITFAKHAPESVGQLLPLEKPLLSLGRSSRSDLVVAEHTVSSLHARLLWQEGGSWVVMDADSTNGTYVDHAYEKQKKVVLRHGAEVQLGELRVMLVSFAAGSRTHRHARRYLGRRDGLTGLSLFEVLSRHLREDARFSEWAEIPMHVGRFRLECPPGEERTRQIISLLALRTAAHRVVATTEALLLSITPIVCGRLRGDEPHEFVVSMIGPSQAQATATVEAALSVTRGVLPPGYVLHGAALPLDGEVARILEGR